MELLLNENYTLMDVIYRYVYSIEGCVLTEQEVASIFFVKLLWLKS